MAGKTTSGSGDGSGGNAGAKVVSGKKAEGRGEGGAKRRRG